jgi:antitoxin YefM
MGQPPHLWCLAQVLTIAVLSDPEIRADLAESAEGAMRGDFTTEDEMQAILDARLGRKTGR